ncbi:hypothetical protein K523DRAFT_358839 [Schizophyllum commune Tattone D]|nr:hypothetical protein K523DRAFT_358839 [Schizophyllum commune Tattone D]
MLNDLRSVQQTAVPFCAPQATASAFGRRTGHPDRLSDASRRTSPDLPPRPSRSLPLLLDANTLNPWDLHSTDPAYDA